MTDITVRLDLYSKILLADMDMQIILLRQVFTWIWSYVD